MVIKDISYGNGERNLYDLYLPEDLNRSKEQGLVICIHGGGWNSLSKETMENECQWFASLGYLAAAINYSLLKVVVSNSLMKVEDNGVSVYTMLDDIEHAICEIKSKTSRMGIKVGKIALLGASSGAHLAMLYAYMKKKRSAIPISFVCNMVGPCDISLFEEFPLRKEETYSLLSGLCGIAINENNIESQEVKAKIRAISPVEYIDNTSPPTLSAYGGKDNVVTLKHLASLKKRFEDVGGVNEYIVFPNSGHDLANDKECLKLFKDKQIEFTKRYFD